MGGDLTLREPPEIGEDQHLAVGRRELRESPYHVEGAQDLLDAVALAGNLLLVGDRSHDLYPPHPATCEISYTVACYAVDPGRETGPRGIVARRVAPYGEKHVLH